MGGLDECDSVSFSNHFVLYVKVMASAQHQGSVNHEASVNQHRSGMSTHRPSSALFTSTYPGTCTMCGDEQGKYRCPACQATSCSLPCVKGEEAIRRTLQHDVHRPQHTSRRLDARASAHAQNLSQSRSLTSTSSWQVCGNGVPINTHQDDASHRLSLPRGRIPSKRRCTPHTWPCSPP